MSEEQHVVFDHIRTGDNVVVDACAGSGKSTTILSIAKYIPELTMCMVTYNSTLCSETRQKVDELQLSNIRVHTYHSINVQYYSRDGHTDTSMRRILRNNAAPVCTIPRFHILAIDEAQDMTELYFRFLVKYIKDHEKQNPGSVIQILILGDQMQGLYEFKGSDTRYLTRGDEVWRGFPLLKSPVWQKCTLRTSYRITDQMGLFVNKIMLGADRLLTCRSGEPVIYLRRRLWDAINYIRSKIVIILTEGRGTYGDFFILSGSTRTKDVRLLENTLVEIGIPCYLPSLEDDKIDDRVIDGKVVFSTFHSVKGRQRKYVFVLGFDNSYFEYLGRDLCPTECPSTLYVACTRATHGLYLIERNDGLDNRPLKFLKASHIQMQNEPYMKFNGIPQTLFPEVSKRQNQVVTRNVTPTELIRFIPEDVLDEIVPILDEIFICETPPVQEEDVIEIPTMIETKPGRYEDVSDLNGIAIPAVYFDHLFSPEIEHPPIFRVDSLSNIENAGAELRDIINRELSNLRPNDYPYLQKLAEETMPSMCTTLSEYLYLTNLYCAIKDKLCYKIKQIERDQYTWLTESIVQKFFERMNIILSDECFDDETGELNAKSEVTILRGMADDLLHARIDRELSQFIPPINAEGKRELFRFSARLDLITPKCIWEMKCTADLSTDHFLQVAIYAWLWRMTMENMMELLNIREFRLINIKSGQIWRLNASTSVLTNIVVLLLKSKYGTKKVRNDVDFLESAKGAF